MDSKKLKKGAKVSWSSSGQGVKSKKTGIVVGYLEGGKDVKKALPKSVLVSQIMTRKPKSSHNRYLVRVAAGKKGGKDGYYVPRTSTIHDQNGLSDKKAPARKAGKKSAKKAARKASTRSATTKKKSAKRAGKKAAKRAGKKSAKRAVKRTAKSAVPAVPAAA